VSGNELNVIADKQRSHYGAVVDICSLRYCARVHGFSINIENYPQSWYLKDNFSIEKQSNKTLSK